MAVSHTPLSGVLGHTKEGQPIPPSTLPNEAAVPLSEPPLSPDVARYIEQHDAAQVPPDVRAMGVTASTDTPAVPDVTFPISDAQIVEGRTKPIGSGKRWLSELLTYRLRQMGASLKRVKGDVKRVQTA